MYETLVESVRMNLAVYMHRYHNLFCGIFVPNESTLGEIYGWICRDLAIIPNNAPIHADYRETMKTQLEHPKGRFSHEIEAHNIRARTRF